jgi:hypothetical protein
MENVRLPQAAPAGCYKINSAGGEDVVINTVTKLTKLGSPVNNVIADVVLQFIIAQQ